MSVRAAWERLLRWLSEFPAPFVVAIVVAVATVVAVELSSRGFAEFFATRPLEAGILSGLSLSLIVAIFVERVLAASRRAKWDSVRIGAFEALAYEVTLVIDRLNELVTGTDFAATPYAEYADAVRERLRDVEWAAGTCKEIEGLRIAYRNGFARWTGALLATGELSVVLHRIASLNIDLSALEEWLRIRCGRSGFTSLSWTEDGLAAIWDCVLAEALSLREDLWREAKGGTDPAWRAFREPVSDDRRSELNCREEEFAAGGPRKVHLRIAEPPPHPARLARASGLT